MAYRILTGILLAAVQPHGEANHARRLLGPHIVSLHRGELQVDDIDGHRGGVDHVVVSPARLVGQDDPEFVVQVRVQGAVNGDGPGFVPVVRSERQLHGFDGQARLRQIRRHPHRHAARRLRSQLRRVGGAVPLGHLQGLGRHADPALVVVFDQDLGRHRVALDDALRQLRAQHQEHHLVLFVDIVSPCLELEFGTGFALFEDHVLRDRELILFHTVPKGHFDRDPDLPVRSVAQFHLDRYAAAILHNVGFRAQRKP